MDLTHFVSCFPFLLLDFELSLCFRISVVLELACHGHFPFSDSISFFLLRIDFVASPAVWHLESSRSSTRGDALDSFSILTANLGNISKE